MNFGLAKEIYGLNAWCIDPISFHSLSAILKNIQNGVSLDVPEIKYNSISVFDLKSETRLIQREWQLDNSADFEGIGIVNLDGVITKNGGASSYGMNQLSQSMLSMAKDSRIKAFIIPTDSGGGSSAAVEIMVDTINEVKKTKPVYALVTKGGMAGSAAYGIISAATKIYSESEENIVGSVGTMIQFSAKPHGNVDQDGEKTIVLYATKSTMKNKAFEEAVNNDNYSLLINDLLDPINENFIAQTLSNRPQLEGTKFDNGHTVFAKDAIGTFIDGIASFDQVVEMVLSDAKEMSTNSNININPNSKMTKEELKQSNPDVYASIATEGAEAQQEIVNSWLPFFEADSKAVLEGIKSGKPLLESQKNVFLVSMAQKGKVEALNADNAPAITTAQSATVVNAEEAKNEELENAFKFEI